MPVTAPFDRGSFFFTTFHGNISDSLDQSLSGFHIDQTNQWDVDPDLGTILLRSAVINNSAGHQVMSEFRRVASVAFNFHTTQEGRIRADIGVECTDNEFSLDSARVAQSIGRSAMSGSQRLFLTLRTLATIAGKPLSMESEAKVEIQGYKSRRVKGGFHSSEPPPGPIVRTLESSGVVYPSGTDVTVLVGIMHLMDADVLNATYDGFIVSKFIIGAVDVTVIPSLP